MYSMKSAMSMPFWQNGPAPGEFYNFTGGPRAATAAVQPDSATYKALKAAGYPTGEIEHSNGPTTTGTSVVGIKYDNGVMIAADNLISYGSLARYQNVVRCFKINEKTVLGFSGDFADFQSVKRSIDQKIVEDMCYGQEIALKPRALYSWLTRLFYQRRCRMNPMWLEMVVGGVDTDGPFLGHIDLRGRAYSDDFIATGFGKHLALPLLREKLEKVGNKRNLTQAEASDVLRKVMEILYYRDCRASPKYTVAVCTSEGAVVQGPFNVSENWELATMVKGY